VDSRGSIVILQLPDSAPAETRGDPRSKQAKSGPSPHGHHSLILPATLLESLHKKGYVQFSVPSNRWI
jgi:hypothetical protein